MRGRRADIIRAICTRIEHLYADLNEQRNIALWVASHIEGVAFGRYLAEPAEEVDLPGLDEKIEQLACGRPVQYVVGQTEFCGRSFAVSEGVLIPRPETEELTEWARQQASHYPKARILDLCTGSGCIAITLAKDVADASVTAIDLSAEALDIARENNKRHGVSVELMQADVLGELAVLGERKFDVIISNPPYIPRSERQQMRINVTEHEPAMALYVDDEHPLIFYEAIADHARRLLGNGGSLLFEVHENYAAHVADMLRERGFSHVTIRNDFRAKPRMICSLLNQR